MPCPVLTCDVFYCAMSCAALTRGTVLQYCRMVLFRWTGTDLLVRGYQDMKTYDTAWEALLAEKEAAIDEIQVPTATLVQSAPTTSSVLAIHRGTGVRYGTTLSLIPRSSSCGVGGTDVRSGTSVLVRGLY